MVFGSLVRYGIPLSFVYCTIYQQAIWREADESLIIEQKRTWRKFFQLIDDGYTKLVGALNLKQDSDAIKLNLLEKIDNVDLKQCWNSKVSSAFNKVANSSMSSVFNANDLAKSLGLSKS